MSFIADKQTLADLNLTGRYNTHSIYNLFNKTQTQGGAALLNEMFLHPLSSPEEINHRSSIFEFFQHKTGFPLNDELVIALEDYLSTGGPNSKPASYLYTFRCKILQRLGIDDTYDHMKKNLLASVLALQKLNQFFVDLVESAEGTAYEKTVSDMLSLFGDRRLSWMGEVDEREDLTVLKLARIDHCLRAAIYSELRQMMSVLYELDVFMAVAQVARERKFNYAEALPASENLLEFEDLMHPALEKGTGNNLLLNGNCNVLFLTGANMAGKSTFMKAVAIATYLAHMGFPVAAANMSFSVMDGVYTSINVPDDLNKGYSHFYAEVLRVKKVAQEVSTGKKLLIIFDELFKGTNVKDAFDATLSVTEAFSECRECMFVISTHIVEVGEALQPRTGSIMFACLPTMMEGVTPRYTYRLKEGITADRHGMMIIRNEHILERILEGSKS